MPAASTPQSTRATIIPCLRYRDASAAIEWLCKAFGLRKHLVVPGPNNTIAHAQLEFGNGMIMLGSVVESEFGKLMAQPDEIGARETQCSYIVVADADATYAQAKAAGATIVLDIKDEDYGGRGFTCRDPEGHLWNFGTCMIRGSDFGRIVKSEPKHLEYESASEKRRPDYADIVHDTVLLAIILNMFAVLVWLGSR